MNCAQWFCNQSVGCWPVAVLNRGALVLLPPHPNKRRVKAEATKVLINCLVLLIVFPFGA